MSANDGGALPQSNDAVKQGQRELAALARQYQTAGFIRGMRIRSSEEAARHRESLETAEAALGRWLHYLSKVHAVMPSSLQRRRVPIALDGHQIKCRSSRTGDGTRAIETGVPPKASALDQADGNLQHIDRQPATSSFLIFVLHITAGVAHGFNHLIQGHKMLSVPP